MRLEYLVSTRKQGRKKGRDQDGRIGHFWLQSPSQEDQIATIHRKDTFMKISEPRGEPEEALWPQKPRRAVLDGREEQIHLDCIAPPQDGIVLHQGL